MKRTVFLLPILAMLAGCTKQQSESFGSEGAPVTFDKIVAHAAAPGTASKTALDGLEMLWSEGDAINVAADPQFSAKPYSITLHEFGISSGAGEKSAVFASDTPLTGTVMYAAYPASSYTKEGEKYIYFDYPSVQNYVPDGIEDGIIPMYAHAFTDPSDVEFMYGSGILRINLYSTNDVSLEKIIVTTDEPASGVFVVDPALKRMPRVKNGTNSQTQITYNIGGVSLSKDPSAPTQFNICLANTMSNGAKVTESGAYSTVKVDIYAADGSVLTKTIRDQVIEGGVIYSKSTIAFDGKICYSVGDYYPNPSVDTDDPEASAAVEASFFLNLKAIVCMTVSGRTAQVISYYRPSCPIIACVADQKAARQLNLSYGVHPVMASIVDDMDDMKAMAIDLAISTGIVKKGDLVALVTGSTTGGSYTSDCMQIATL